MLTTTADNTHQNRDRDSLPNSNAGVHYDPVTGARYAEKKQYRDNVTVTGETFNGTKFKHELYFQNGATKEEVENALRAREPSAQRASLKIVQGETNEQAVARQKKVDDAKFKSEHRDQFPDSKPAIRLERPAPAPVKK